MKLWTEAMPYKMDEEAFSPYVTPYMVEGAKTAVLVCPGGGYEFRAEHEGKDIALWLNAVGISAFVLEYRVYPYRAPAPGADVQRAMRLARREGQKRGIEKIGVMGFSAGGHLAATLSVHYGHTFYEKTDTTDEVSARPDFSVLCYPVIDMLEYRHEGSRCNLLGNTPERAQTEFYCLHMQVSDDTPPAFIWHTAEDSSVPVENSMLYALALSRHKIPYELHIYPHGSHGMGLAEEHPHVKQWPVSLEKWLISMGC